MQYILMDYVREVGFSDLAQEEQDHCGRKHPDPGEIHQLVISEARQSGAYPYIKEEQETGFRQEPEQRHQDIPEHGRHVRQTEPDEQHAENG